MGRTDEVRRILDVLASVVIILAGGMILWLGLTGRIGGSSNNQARVPSAPINPVENIENQKLTVRIIPSQAIMPAGAKIGLIEFSDFECPFCLRFSTDTLPQIKREFVDSGKIAYGFRHNPIESIHPRAFDAALGSSCAAEQGKFWVFHDLIFGPANAIRRPMTEAAKEVELHLTRFDECMLRNADLVKSDLADAERLGLASTPSFLLGSFRNANEISATKRIIGAQSFATFKSAIDELLAQ